LAPPGERAAWRQWRIARRRRYLRSALKLMHDQTRLRQKPRKPPNLSSNRQTWPVAVRQTLPDGLTLPVRET
jgi:hypothetical protein